MRSLSPSRTLTCTRTVSPDFIEGRSASCDFSTISIAPIVLLLQSTRPERREIISLVTLRHQLAQNLPFLFVQCRRLQQVWPPRQRARQRLSFPPPPYFGVIARQQHLR